MFACQPYPTRGGRGRGERSFHEKRTANAPKMALMMVTLAAVSRLALAAEERYAESPEAFRAICDKAMPDLLLGSGRCSPQGGSRRHGRLVTLESSDPIRAAPGQLRWRCRLDLPRRKETRRHVLPVCLLVPLRPSRGGVAAVGCGGQGTMVFDRVPFRLELAGRARPSPADCAGQR